MIRRFVFPAIGLLLALAIGGVALAQEQSEVEAKFGDWQIADIEAAGYAASGPCVSAELVGAPPALGAMGQHYINESLLDGTLDVLNPEVVLVNPADGKLTAVEWLVIDPATPPTLFGQEFEMGPPDIPGSYALHMWLIDNPNGQFADFNPSISCPAAAPLLPQTGGAETPVGALVGLALGAMLLAGGLTVLRLRRGIA